ncbi:MAG: TolB family protein [Longimicrobiales bacterium]
MTPTPTPVLPRESERIAFPVLAACLTVALASCAGGDSDREGARAASGAPAEVVAEAVWSADGKRLAATWTMEDRARLMGLFGPAEGAPSAEATGLPLAQGDAGWASWSPDGLWVAYAAGRVGSRDIHRARPDGMNAENLTPDPADDYDPAYSPDGRTLVFVSTRGGGMPRLHAMSADGGEARLFADLGGPVRRPMWSPDGARLALQVTEAGEEVIYLVSSDGKGWGRLGTGTLPAWFSDGERVAYAERDSIFWRPANGGLRQFVLAGGTAPRPSPAGRWLAFVRTDSASSGLYLLDVLTGSESRVTP